MEPQAEWAKPASTSIESGGVGNSPQWSTRLDWIEAHTDDFHRYSTIREEIGHRVHARLAAYEVSPPVDLVEAIGRKPAESEVRRRWTAAAMSHEARLAVGLDAELSDPAVPSAGQWRRGAQQLHAERLHYSSERGPNTARPLSPCTSVAAADGSVLVGLPELGSGVDPQLVVAYPARCSWPDYSWRQGIEGRRPDVSDGHDMRATGRDVLHAYPLLPGVHCNSCKHRGVRMWDTIGKATGWLPGASGGSLAGIAFSWLYWSSEASTTCTLGSTPILIDCVHTFLGDFTFKEFFAAGAAMGGILGAVGGVVASQGKIA